MRLYNEYVLEDPPVGDSAAIKVICRPVWQAGYLLNSFILGNLSGVTPIHPLGVPGLPWGRKDSELSKAVVVSLGAGTKTTRSFAWNLARRDEVGLPSPCGLLQGTSDPSSLAGFGGILTMRNLNYDELMGVGCLEWIIGRCAEKLVIVDFGASREVTKNFVDAVRNASKLASSVSLTVEVIVVGSECKVFSEEERKAQNEVRATLNPVQMNTSAVKDRAVEQLGVGRYLGALEETYHKCISENGLGSFSLHRFQGVRGEKGIEGAWKALCERALEPNAGIVVKVI